MLEEKRHEYFMVDNDNGLERKSERHIYKVANEIIFGNANQLCFIQIPSKKLKDTGTQLNN